MTPLYRRAVRWRVCGWVLFAIALVVFVVSTRLPTTSAITHPLYLAVIGTSCAASACFVWANMLLRRFNRRAATGFCQSCGYALTTGMHTCPECGQQRRV